ncbi:molybdenum cofactor guanylyltransferase, partial [Microbacterium sp.]|uniref:molybdenum cofactor guanylyltransferase n=2 Tax=Microbacterium TaxID=33882 RepID=UPI003F95EC4F
MTPNDGSAPNGAVEGIVLAGGRASRLDGIDKPRLRVGDGTLLDGVIRALRDAGCRRIVVAGPAAEETAGDDVEWVLEDPPFGGPVAGIAAALEHITSPEVFVLAGDLAAPAEVVARLREHAPSSSRPDAATGRTVSDDASAHEDGRCLSDPDGRVQWLAGVHRTIALRDALAALPNGGRDASLRQLLRGIRITTITASTEAVRDVDTWDDVETARRERAERR